MKRGKKLRYYKNRIPGIWVSTKPIGVLDILVAVVVFVCMWHYIPLDFGTGAFEQPEENIQTVTEYVTTQTIEPGSLSRVFKSSCIYNGGTVLGFNGGNISVKDGDVILRGQYKNGRYVDGTTQTHPCPTGMTVAGHLLTEIDGKIYIDNVASVFDEQIYGITDLSIKGNLYNDDGTVNYDAVRSLLARSDVEEITFAEAATVYPLIRDHILIGYADGVAWFVGYDDDGDTYLLKSTEDKTEQYPKKIKGTVDEVYVVDNKFIVYSQNNDVQMHFIENDAHKKWGLDKDFEKWGNVKQIGYAVLEEYGRYSVNVLTDNYIISSKFTDSSMEDLYHTIRELESSVDSMCVTTNKYSTYIWLESNGKYKELEVRGREID